MKTTTTQFAKSAIRLSASVPIWSAQQFVNLAVPSRERVAEVTQSFQSMADTASKGIKQPLRSVAAVSEKVPSFLIDTSQKMLHRRSTLDAATKFAQRSVDMTRLSITPMNVASAIAEIKNKAEVFYLAAQNNRMIGIPSPPPNPFPLAKLAEKAYERGDFPAIWSLEGLGREYGNSFFKRGQEPSGILKGILAADVPTKSLTMLHAGMGAAFAQRLLKDANFSSTSTLELTGLIDRFVRLCHENAQKGLAGAALEALGYVTRTLHSDLVSSIDDVLDQRKDAGELRGYYWHGIGRALYALPMNFLPFHDRQVFDSVRAEAPEEHLNSALAGATWAFVIVNNRTPQVLSNLLMAKHSNNLAKEPGFVNGIQSAMIICQDLAPEAKVGKKFYHHDPNAGNEVAEHWRNLVREPSETAIRDYWPALQRNKQLGAIFKFTDLIKVCKPARRQITAKIVDVEEVL